MRSLALSIPSFFLVALIGCSDPARPHLERLVNELTVATATGYVHSDSYSRDEHRVHYLHEQSRATNRVLRKFLLDDPPVKDELKAFLRDWEKVTSENEALHKTMIDEGRFTYNENEKDRAEALSKADVVAGLEILDHLKGY
jgi:hypothetical protein